MIYKIAEKSVDNELVKIQKLSDSVTKKNEFVPSGLQ